MPYLEYKPLRGKTIQLSFDHSHHNEVMRFIRNLRKRMNRR